MRKTVAYSPLWDECEITIKRKGKIRCYRKPRKSYVAKEIRRLMLKYQADGFVNYSGSRWTVIGD